MVSSYFPIGAGRRTTAVAWHRAPLVGAMIVCLVSGLAGCQSATARSLPPPITPVGTMVPMTVFYESREGGVRYALRAVIDTRDEFERLWQEIHAGATPTPSVPIVDFKREMDVAASTGFQASVGSTIAIVGVRDRDNLLEVTVEVRPFPVGCDGYPAVTYSTTMVRVPATRSTPIFQDRVIRTRC